jgi:hypothetical protein
MLRTRDPRPGTPPLSGATRRSGSVSESAQPASRSRSQPKVGDVPLRHYGRLRPRAVRRTLRRRCISRRRDVISEQLKAAVQEFYAMESHASRESAAPRAPRPGLRNVWFRPSENHLEHAESVSQEIRSSASADPAYVCLSSARSVCHGIDDLLRSRVVARPRGCDNGAPSSAGASTTC